jgi:hypothetical protein
MIDDYEPEFGYSMTEFANGLGRKPYQLPEYDNHSIETVETYLNQGRYQDRLKCTEHLQFLEVMEKKLSLILMAEEREGVSNWELREALHKIRELAKQLSHVLNFFEHSEIIYA